MSAAGGQRGHERPRLLRAWLIVWLVACVAILGLDDLVAAGIMAEEQADAPPAAERPRTLSEAVALACGPESWGRPVPGTRDIQCFDGNNKPTFYAVGAQP